MPKRHDLKSVRMLAENDETHTSREVSDRLATLRAEEHRLAQLQDYLDEYQDLLAAGTSGISIATVRSRRRFVERLQAAVDQQQELVNRLHEQAEGQMNRWREARSRSLSLQKFSERMTAEQESRDARREQAKLDEIGRNLFLRGGD